MLLLKFHSTKRITRERSHCILKLFDLQYFTVIYVQRLRRYGYILFYFCNCMNVEAVHKILTNGHNCFVALFLHNAT